MLQLLESEIVVRATGGTTVQRTPRKIRYVLEQMSLASWQTRHTVAMVNKQAIKLWCVGAGRWGIRKNTRNAETNQKSGAAPVEFSKASELPGACRVLQLLESEIVVRATGGTTVQRTPRKIRYVLEQMSLANLVSLICSTLRGRFPKLIAIELNNLRETAKILES